MAKGFKDSSGKFHPTGNNGTSSKNVNVEPKAKIPLKDIRIYETFA